MRAIILVIFTLLFSSNLKSQNTEKKTKFYKSEKGEVYTEEGYQQLKDRIVSEFQKINKTVTVGENFGEVARSGDSLIQNFTLKISSLPSGQVQQSEVKPAFGKHLIGKRLPVTVLHNIDGDEIDIKELNGKPTMVNFWFTSCKPCIDEFSALNQIRKKYKDQVNFISITFDDKLAVEKLTAKFAYDFDKYINAQKYINQLGISSYPTSLFMDKNGVVQYAEGGIPYIIENGTRRVGDGKEFEQIIDELLRM